MDGSSYTTKHRDSKLMAQVKWLQEDDYAFLDYDDPNTYYVQDKLGSENLLISASDEIKGGNTSKIKRKVKKPKSKRSVEFLENKSNIVYSGVSDVDNTVTDLAPAVKQKKKDTISVSNRNKFVDTDSAKFAIFLQKWSAYLPIIKYFNDSLPITTSDSIPKLTYYQEDGDTVLDVKFKLKILFNYLICKLCKGILYNAYTIKGCLHTFCKSCIIVYLILIKKQCPVCHQHINTNLEESIEYDNCIQSIVDKLFPQYNINNKFDNDNNNQVAEINPVGTNSNLYVKSQDLALKDEMLKKYKNYLWEASQEAVEIERSIYKTGITSKDKLNQSITSLKACLTLTPIDVDSGPACYIAVEKEMFISDLRNYLLLKLEKYGLCNVVFYLKNEPLPMNHTIEFICKSRRMHMIDSINLKYELKYK